MDRRTARDTFLQLGGVVILIVGALLLGSHVRDNPDLTGLILQFGYPGVFVASIISGFNIIVPIPVATFLPAFLAAGLHPIILIVLMSCGMTLADGAAFIIGKAARTLALNRHQVRIKGVLERLHKRHPMAPIVALYFYASFMPLPNELAVIPLAVLGYQLRPVMTAVFLGNVTFNVIVTLVTLQAL